MAVGPVSLVSVVRPNDWADRRSPDVREAFGRLSWRGRRRLLKKWRRSTWGELPACQSLRLSISTSSQTTYVASWKLTPRLLQQFSRDPRPAQISLGAEVVTVRLAEPDRVPLGKRHLLARRHLAGFLAPSSSNVRLLRCEQCNRSPVARSDPTVDPLGGPTGWARGMP
jgi:hypothetical protein